MKLLFKSKDGGPESNVTGYWLIEWKKYFSIVLLRFDKGSREAFHNHAFNAWSIVLSGAIIEYFPNSSYCEYFSSGDTIYTSRERMHKVEGLAKKTWILSFRGPWSETWNEYFDKEDKTITLTNGRKQIG